MTIELSAKATAWWTYVSRKLRDERGMSQTTENLIILAVVAAVAISVGVFFRGYIAGLLANIPQP